MTELTLALTDTWRGALGGVALVAAKAGDAASADRASTAGAAKRSLNRDT
jgi:hypothetical protein